MVCCRSRTFSASVDLSDSSGASLESCNFATGKVTLHRGFSKDTRVDTASSALTVSPVGSNTFLSFLRSFFSVSRLVYLLVNVSVIDFAFQLA